ISIDMSPTSGTWRNLCGSSIAYGLTEGGCNAQAISLTALGRRIIAPEIEGDDTAAKIEAILKPRIIKEFLQKYDRAKFPSDIVAQNILVTLGIPKDRTANALAIIKENASSVGIVRNTKTGPFVSLDVKHANAPVQQAQDSSSTDSNDNCNYQD